MLSQRHRGCRLSCVWLSRAVEQEKSQQTAVSLQIAVLGTSCLLALSPSSGQGGAAGQAASRSPARWKWRAGYQSSKAFHMPGWSIWILPAIVKPNINPEIAVLLMSDQIQEYFIWDAKMYGFIQLPVLQITSGVQRPCESRRADTQSSFVDITVTDVHPREHHHRSTPCSSKQDLLGQGDTSVPFYRAFTLGLSRHILIYANSSLIAMQRLRQPH